MRLLLDVEHSFEKKCQCVVGRQVGLWQWQPGADGLGGGGVLFIRLSVWRGVRSGSSFQTSAERFLFLCVLPPRKVSPPGTCWYKTDGETMSTFCSHVLKSLLRYSLNDVRRYGSSLEDYSFPFLLPMQWQSHFWSSDLLLIRDTQLSLVLNISEPSQFHCSTNYLIFRCKTVVLCNVPLNLSIFKPFFSDDGQGL